MVAKPLCPLYKYMIKPLDRAYYPELRYKYACNMAHPSYLGLIQYRDAYKDGSIIGLEETAIMQMNSVLSVFIMDFMERFPPVKVLYNNLDIESQFMISMYNHAFREKSKKSSVI